MIHLWWNVCQLIHGRISHLELLDEIEELDLLLEHYAVTWGVKLSDADAQTSWKDWGFRLA